MYLKNNDFISAIQINNIQLKQLNSLITYLNEKSPFYQNLFKQNKININEITSLEQLQQFPTTDKDDLQYSNWDFLCVEPSEILEYTTTSGTLGTPVTIALTRNDLDRLAYNEYLSFTTVNASKTDVFQLALTLDKQFMAGMAYYLGANKLGAGVVRTGPGVPSMQWDTIFRVKTTVLIAVPTFIIKLIEYADDQGINLNSSPVKKIICIGENIRDEQLNFNSLGKKIRDRWNIELFSTYASTEMQTAFTECEAGAGGHLHHELLIAEVIDDHGNSMPSGSYGELTITTLGIEGMPLLRYRTGDICRLYEQHCACGRHTLRISPIVGRKKQMIKFKGTTVYPPIIFDILNSKNEIKDYLVEVFSNELGTDEILIHIVMDNPSEKIAAMLKSYLHAALRVRPEITFADIEVIRNLQVIGDGRKVSRFFDRRTLGNSESFI